MLKRMLPDCSFESLFYANEKWIIVTFETKMYIYAFDTRLY